MLHKYPPSKRHTVRSLDLCLHSLTQLDRRSREQRPVLCYPLSCSSSCCRGQPIHVVCLPFIIAILNIVQHQYTNERSGANYICVFIIFFNKQKSIQESSLVCCPYTLACLSSNQPSESLSLSHFRNFKSITQPTYYPTKSFIRGITHTYYG